MSTLSSSHSLMIIYICILLRKIFKILQLSLLATTLQIYIFIVQTPSILRSYQQLSRIPTSNPVSPVPVQLPYQYQYQSRFPIFLSLYQVHMFLVLSDRSNKGAFGACPVHSCQTSLLPKGRVILEPLEVKKSVHNLNADLYSALNLQRASQRSENCAKRRSLDLELQRGVIQSENPRRGVVKR